MESKYGFTKMNIQEFEQWITNLRVGRTIDRIQQHHTYSPSYQHFNKSNHFERQKAMRDYHMNHNGWSDIAQHFTTFPDGTILTGRSLEVIPAGIKGQNATGICIEHLGNFDTRKDQMTAAHRDAIVAMTAILLRKFNLPVTNHSVIYHHWYNLTTGERNDGTHNNKSCPGSSFFGGNKPHHCDSGFLPLVTNWLSGSAPGTGGVIAVLRYAVVTADNLNVRTGPATDFPKADRRESLVRGAVIRVYAEQDAWLKISGSADHWVSGRYTIPVRKGRVTSASLNVRSGPGTSFPIVGALSLNDEAYVSEEVSGWLKAGITDRWVSGRYIDFG
ncbi:MAG TPA: N-acetylmuramoyl-L-alanine amidase [Bacteroidales bacterium]|nr:N-acetylmuramoyl-L-alanine amidase [Bacteroidales bacterium]